MGVGWGLSGGINTVNARDSHLLTFLTDRQTEVDRRVDRKVDRKRFCYNFTCFRCLKIQ